MEHHRSDKTEISGNEPRGKTSLPYRSEEKKGVFKRGKAQSRRNHIDCWVNRLVNASAFIKADAAKCDDMGAEILQNLLNSRPREQEVKAALENILSDPL